MAAADRKKANIKTQNHSFLFFMGGPTISAMPSPIVPEQDHYRITL